MGIGGYKWSDSFKGQWRALRKYGMGANFSRTLQEINKVKRERKEAEDPATRHGRGVGLRTDIGGGEYLTVNPTDNPNVEGGWYQTTTNDQGDKSTAVYDKDGNMPSGKKMGDNDKYQ